MEDIISSPTRTTATPVDSTARPERDDTPATARMKKDCLSFMVSLRESFLYGKASLVGLAKKLTASSEREAMEADLTAEKMQVDAANAAEDDKARIRKSN